MKLNKYVVDRKKQKRIKKFVILKFPKQIWLASFKYYGIAYALEVYRRK